MSKKRLSNLRLNAAASGPGVGGTKTWGANNPVDNATVKPVKGILVCFESVLFILDMITKAASQKIGIDTKYPIKLMAYGKGIFFRYFRIPQAKE